MESDNLFCFMLFKSIGAHTRRIERSTNRANFTFPKTTGPWFGCVASVEVAAPAAIVTIRIQLGRGGCHSDGSGGWSHRPRRGRIGLWYELPRTTLASRHEKWKNLGSPSQQSNGFPGIFISSNKNNKNAELGFRMKEPGNSRHVPSRWFRGLDHFGPVRSFFVRKSRTDGNRKTKRNSWVLEFIP